MVSGRRFVPAFLLVLGAAVFALTVWVTTPAWSQSNQQGKLKAQQAIRTAAADSSEGDLADSEVLEEDTDNNPDDGASFDQPTRIENDNIDLIRILDAEDCDVDPGAIIVFEDDDDNRFIVIDDTNAQINERNGEIRVRDDADDEDNDNPADQDIEFLTQDGKFVELSEDVDLEIVSTAGIDCGSDNGGSGGGGSGSGGGSEPGSGGGSEPGSGGGSEPGSGGGSETGTETGTEDTTIEDTTIEDTTIEDTTIEDTTIEDTNGDVTTTDEVTTNDGEDTNGDNTDEGVSASADENGASARAGGSSADAGGDTSGEDTGDPDTQAPERSPRGDVVDEVDTGGSELPDTGGPPVFTGAMLALVLFGVALLVLRLAMIWRNRMQR